ncbi:MAG: CBS domain-containing protein [Candidatus Polarisedimenticolaceae bacterium]|nr:CBS domain-containing protein [Candidatus Polarisedimenticolaceae bacterium]
MSKKPVVRVRDVMKTNFRMVDGMSTVAEALNTMLEVESLALVVQKRSVDDEFGMVMLSDIARQVLAEDKAPERVNIYEIMSKPVIEVKPEMDIRYCARLFGRFRISRALVTEKGEAIGVVSYTDMVIKGMINR